MSFGTHTKLPRFEPREVLLAKITFPNKEEKIRPILVISKFSSVIYSPTSLIVVCVSITSNLSNDPFMVEIKNSDMEENIFPKPSQVVCDNFFTVLKTDVKKKIGKVTPTFYARITDILKNSILEI